MSSIANPFSFYGRLAPRPYWLLVGMIIGFRVLAVMVVLARPDLAILAKTDFLLAFVVLLVGKRMKDFGVSAIWGWASIALIAFLIPIAVVVLSPHPAGGADIPAWLGMLVFCSLLTLIVGVGLKKGDVGPNRYGDVPGRGWFGSAST